MNDFDEVPDGTNAIPGQVIIKLTQTAQRSMTADVPSGPLHGIMDHVPNNLGVPSIDSVLKKYKARLINRLHSPMPSATLTASATAEAAGALTSTFRVRFDDATDPEKVAKELDKASGVSDASAEYYRYSSATPNDPDFGRLWGMQAINAPAAWNRDKGCSNVIVGVLDSGCDLNHPDLAANLIQGRDMVDLPGATPPPGFHFEGDRVGRDNIPQDEVGHGTHVAGTIGAVGNNGTGVVGVCWQVKMMPVKVLTRIVNNNDPTDVRGSGSSADVAAGVRWAADNGAHIINMSLGSSQSTFVERDAIAYAIAKGVLIVAAMGNHGTSANHFPAAYPGVFSVGAINQAEQLAGFSGTGSHIDVVGPGVNIWSTDWDDTYSAKSGTSMATPHVAGLAALMKCCKFSLTADEIKDMIRQTAKPLRVNPGDPVPNNSYGHGLIDAKAALDRSCPMVLLPGRPPLPCVFVPPSLPCIIPPPCRIPPPPPCRIPPPPCGPCLGCLPPPPPCLAPFGGAQDSAAPTSETAAAPSATPPCVPCVGPAPGPCLPPPPCVACPPPPPPCVPCGPCLPPPPCFPCGPCKPCGPCGPCGPCTPCLPPPPPCLPCVPPPPCGPCILAPNAQANAAQTAAGTYAESGQYDWSQYGANPYEHAQYDWSQVDWSHYAKPDGDGS
ncbi:MAG: S8 family peptidase [Sulfitobacter sp.]